MKKLLKWVVIVLAGLFVLGLIVGQGDKKGTATAAESANGEAEETAAAAPPAPAVEVSATQLFQDYDANEVAADQKYKGKRLKVTGSVAGINKNAFDNIYVEIATPNEFSSVHAQGIPEATAAALQKGQAIEVSCNGAGLMMGSPMLDECSVL